MAGLLSNNDPLSRDLSNVSFTSFSNKVNQVVPSPVNAGDGTGLVVGATLGSSQNIRTIKGINGTVVSTVADTIEISAPGSIGGMSYEGVWNASTNTPTLSTPEASGNYYVVSVAGTTLLNGVSEWNIGDWIISTGQTGEWQKVDNSEKYPINDSTVSTGETYSSSKVESRLGAHLLNTNSRLEYNADFQAISGNHSIRYFTSSTELPPGWDAPGYVITGYPTAQLPIGLDSDIAAGFLGYSISPVPANHTELYIWGTTTAISFKSFMLGIRLNSSQIYKFSINGADIGLVSQDGTPTWIPYSVKDLILSPSLFPSLLVENTPIRFAIQVKKNQTRLYCGVRLFGINSQKLGQIADVILTTPSNSQALIFNGTSWTNQNTVQNVASVATVNSLVATPTTGTANLKGLLGTSYVVITPSTTDLTVSLPKISANKVQVSDLATGWSNSDSTQFCTKIHSTVECFVRIWIPEQCQHGRISVANWDYGATSEFEWSNTVQ
jgi:hypothetical protein